MSSLKLAVDARLPLIAVTSRDTLNLHDILRAILGTKTPLREWKGEVKKEQIEGSVYYAVTTGAMNWNAVYSCFVKAATSLIIVNPDPKQIPDCFFISGEVGTPRSLLIKNLNTITESPKESEKLTLALSGCTIKEATEMACLTMARDKSLTVGGLHKTRKSIFQPQSGLTLVNTVQDYYEPSVRLQEWLDKERNYFLHGTDRRLVARGVLMDGPPGVGKTAGAKWIAEQLGLPLFRVDLGTVKGKYQGQSEGNLKALFDRLDHEAPCVALFDEMEKTFSAGHGDSDDVQTLLLGGSLWWLAEHTSRVLSLMTTNAVHKLPPELHREGRIDETIMFTGLTKEKAVPFVMNLFGTFDDFEWNTPEVSAETIVAATPLLSGHANVYAHAALTKTTYDYIKANLVA